MLQGMHAAPAVDAGGPMRQPVGCFLMQQHAAATGCKAAVRHTSHWVCSSNLSCMMSLPVRVFWVCAGVFLAGADIHDAAVLRPVPPAPRMGHGSVVRLVLAHPGAVLRAVFVHNCVWMVRNVGVLGHRQRGSGCAGALLVQHDGAACLWPDEQGARPGVRRRRGGLLLRCAWDAAAVAQQRVLVAAARRRWCRGGGHLAAVAGCSLVQQTATAAKPWLGFSLSLQLGFSQ